MTKQFNMKRISIAALFVFMATALAIKTSTWLTSTSAHESSATAAVSKASVSSESVLPLKPLSNETGALLLTLKPEKFEPSEVTLTEGQFLLIINNQSGLKNVRFHLN